MSDAFYTNLPATIASIGALLAVLVSMRQNSNSAAAQSQQNQTIIKKADEIHTLTNGTNSQLTSDLRVAKERIEGMERTLAATNQTSLEKIAGLEKMVAKILANGEKKAR